MTNQTPQTVAQQYLDLVDDYKKNIDQITADFLEKIAEIRHQAPQQIEQAARERDFTKLETLLTDELAAA